MCLLGGAACVVVALDVLDTFNPVDATAARGQSCDNQNHRNQADNNPGPRNTRGRIARRRGDRRLAWRRLLRGRLILLARCLAFASLHRHGAGNRCVAVALWLLRLRLLLLLRLLLRRSLADDQRRAKETYRDHE